MALPFGDEKLAIAPKQAQPIDKGLPGPGLLAYIVGVKYGDHLPLYILEKILGRNGVVIGRSTRGWVAGAADLVEAITEDGRLEIDNGRSERALKLVSPSAAGTGSSREALRAADALQTSTASPGPAYSTTSTPRPTSRTCFASSLP